MPAYVIFIRERTTDKSELDAYAKLAPSSLEGLPVKFLAAYGRQEVLEGPVPEGVAIAEFPSMEEAKQWYESPAYLRQYSCSSRGWLLLDRMLPARHSPRAPFAAR